MLRIILGLIIGVVGIGNLVSKADNADPVIGVVALLIGAVLIIWSIASSKSEYDSKVEELTKPIVSIDDIHSQQVAAADLYIPDSATVMPEPEPEPRASTSIESTMDERSSLHAEAALQREKMLTGIDEMPGMSDLERRELHQNVDAAHELAVHEADSKHFGDRVPSSNEERSAESQLLPLAEVDKDFCRWVAVNLGASVAEGGDITVDNAFRAVNAATAFGLVAASQEPKFARSVVVSETLQPEYQENIISSVYNDWPFRNQMQKLGDDQFIGYLSDLIIEGTTGESGNQASWLFKHNQARLLTTHDSTESLVSRELMYTLIFEAVWDALAYWVVLSPEESAAEVIATVESDFQPFPGYGDMFDILLSVYRAPAAK